MVKNAMRKNRFRQICRLLHFADNNALDPADKVWKLRPLITQAKESKSPTPKALSGTPMFMQALGKPGFVSLTPIQRPNPSLLDEPRKPVEIQIAGTSKTECSTIIVMDEEVNECSCTIGEDALLIIDKYKQYMYHVGCSGYRKLDKSLCNPRTTRIVTHNEMFLRLFCTTPELKQRYTRLAYF